MVLFLLTACGKEQIEPIVVPPEPIDHDLFAFTDEEFNVLSAELDISQEISLPAEPIPDHLQGLAQSTSVAFDQPTQVNALLGRLLFYDTRLSSDGQVSCASCHNPELAFGDDLALSAGVRNFPTRRNSIALASTPAFVTTTTVPEIPDNIFRQSLYRDARHGNIRLLIEHRLREPSELGRDLNELLLDLQGDEVYRPLINRALQISGGEFFTQSELITALADFCHTITSMNTPIDQFLNQEALGQSSEELAVTFGEQVVAGAEVFNTNCATCHGEDFAKTNTSFSNNGLAEEYQDRGVGTFLLLPGINTDGGFRTPTLRNVERTAPYMHDGRIATLREVIDHYSEGIQNHPVLDFRLRDQDTQQPLRMDFTEAEKDALIAYLKLATDETLTEREYLQNPWRE